MTAKQARPVDDPKALVPFGWAPGDYYCAKCSDCGEPHHGSDKRSVRCQDCAESLRDAPAPMTHPLTPREKVAVCGWCHGEKTVQSQMWGRVMCAHCRGTGIETYAALASGSGDHAELARLAESATPGPWFETEGHPSGRTYGIHAEAGPVVVFRGIAKPHGQGEHNAAFIAAANPATVLALLAEIAALRAACAKSNDEICQALGKALGYPWFKDDQVNFPGATDENGVCVGDHVAESLADEAARRITEAERKLAEAEARLERWEPKPFCQPSVSSGTSKEAERG